jgi:DNA-binding NarL/FixJ family response regulator
MREQGDRTAVVVDEQPLWLEAMEQLLVRMGMTVVGKATEAQEALDLVDELQPDVLVLDMSVGSGDEALACLRKARSAQRDLKVVALGDEAEPHDVEAAFDAGATVYCTRTAAPDDFASAVRQAFDRSIYVAFGARSTPVSAPAPAADTAELTRRELEILQLVAEGHSNSQLAKMLWVTEQTVKFHLSNIYRKLDVANRTEASRWAQLHGLLSSQVLSASASAA